MTDDNSPGKVLDRIQEVFREVFDDDRLEVTENTSATDIPEWDSLMHITLCIALEQEFGTKLNAVEIASLSKVGNLTKLLHERLG